MRPEGPPTASGPMGSGPTGEIDDVDVELAGGPKPTDLVFTNSVDTYRIAIVCPNCDWRYEWDQPAGGPGLHNGLCERCGTRCNGD